MLFFIIISLFLLHTNSSFFFRFLTFFFFRKTAPYTSVLLYYNAKRMYLKSDKCDTNTNKLLSPAFCDIDIRYHRKFHQRFIYLWQYDEKKRKRPRKSGDTSLPMLTFTQLAQTKDLARPQPSTKEALRQCLKLRRTAAFVREIRADIFENEEEYIRCHKIALKYKFVSDSPLNRSSPFQK